MNWMLEEMNRRHADGISFYALTFPHPSPEVIFSLVIQEYTKEQIEKDNNLPYPKTNYFFWRNENGKKVQVF